jgi:hypothetical protein
MNAKALPLTVAALGSQGVVDDAIALLGYEYSWVAV